MGLGLGLGIQFNSLGGMVSKILTWGKSIPARFWGTTTPEYWGGLDAQAEAHYNRVIADGGVVPAGLGGVNSFFQVVKGVYGTSDINTAISAAYDPHYLGYRLGAGSGTTLGQAARTLYAPKGIFGGIGTGSAFYDSVGVAGNFVSTPSIGIDTNSGMSVDVKVALVSGVTYTSNWICSNDNATTNRNMFLGFTSPSRTLIVYWSNLTRLASSTVALSDGFDGWIRCSLETSGSDMLVRFFTSLDGITYTQLGATVTNSGGANTFQTSNAPFNITGNGGANTIIGKIYRVIYRNASGVVRADFNANQYTGANTWTSTTGEVWTVNSTGAGLADVTQTTAASQPLLLAHTGENYYFSVQAVGNSVSSSTSYATSNIDVEFSVNNQISSDSTPVSGGSGGNPWRVVFNSGASAIQLEYYSGGYRVASASTTLTGNNTWRVTRNSTTGAISFIRNGVTLTTTGSQVSGALDSFPTSLFVGNLGSGANGLQGRINWVKFYISNVVTRDFNPSSYNPATSQTQWTSATGEVWTINTGTANTGYKGVLVTKSIAQMDGIDDTILTTTTSIQTIFNSNNSIGFCGTVFANTNDDFIFGAGADYALNNSYHFWFIGTAGFFPSLATQGTILSNINTSPNATSSNTIFTYTNSIIYGGTSTLRVNQINKTTSGFNNTTNKPNITSGNFGFSVSGYNKHGGQIRTFISSTDATKFVELDNFIRSYNNL